MLGDAALRREAREEVRRALEVGRADRCLDAAGGLSERIADAAERVDAGAGEIGDRKPAEIELPASSPPSTTTERASTPPALRTSARSDSVICSILPAPTVLPAKSSASARVSTRSARSAVRSTVTKSWSDCGKRRDVRPSPHRSRAGRRDEIGEALIVRLEDRGRRRSRSGRSWRPSRPRRATRRRRRADAAMRGAHGRGTSAPGRCRACRSRSTRVSPGSIAAKFSISQASGGGREIDADGLDDAAADHDPLRLEMQLARAAAAASARAARRRAPRRPPRSRPALPPLRRASGRGRSGARRSKHRSAARRRNRVAPEASRMSGRSIAP